VQLPEFAAIPVFRKQCYSGLQNIFSEWRSAPVTEQTVEKRQRGRPRSFHGPAESSNVQSLDRAMAVLALVSASDGMSLSEASSAASLPASTTYRLLTTLERHGIVEFDKVDQLWSVGVGAFRIGSGFLRRRRLVDRARPVLQDLMQTTGETANLGIAEGADVVFVSQVETHQAIRAFFRPGSTSPLHASGIGKAILSWMPADRIHRLLRSTDLDRYTPATLTSEAELVDDLAKARTNGFSFDDEERFTGMRCVASAVFNEFAEPIAGISISGPSVRLTWNQIGLFGPAVAQAAKAVTLAVGGIEPAR
jgi:IclR family acetate operon transcriptional repressor